MRYDDLSEAEGHVKTMLFAVKKDPFMEKKSRDAEVKRLENLLLGLRRAFNPSDLTFEGLNDLKTELQGGWFSAKNKEILQELSFRTVPKLAEEVAAEMGVPT